MADVKWIKLDLDIFNDTKIKIIEGMENGHEISYIWIKLLVEAGKVNDNGLIYIDKDLPFTSQIFSAVYNCPVFLIESALEIFVKFHMIEINNDNVIKIVNWDKHQNVEGMERVKMLGRERARRKRERDKLQKEALESNSNELESTSNVTVTIQNKKEDIDIDKDIDKENKKENNNIYVLNDNKDSYGNTQNSTAAKSDNQVSSLAYVLKGLEICRTAMNQTLEENDSFELL